MVAYLNGEPGGDVVEKALLEQNSECLAHAINLCEVYYLFYRNAPNICPSRTRSLSRSGRLLDKLHPIGRRLSGFRGRDVAQIGADTRWLRLVETVAF